MLNWRTPIAASWRSFSMCSSTSPVTQKRSTDSSSTKHALDDRAIGHAAGKLERLGSISGDPHRQAVLWRPIETELRALVGDLAPFAEVAYHARGLLEHREIRRLLAEDAPRRVSAPDTEVHAPAGKLLEHR